MTMAKAGVRPIRGVPCSFDLQAETRIRGVVVIQNVVLVTVSYDSGAEALAAFWKRSTGRFMSSGISLTPPEANARRQG